MDLTPDQFYKQWLRLGPAAATVSHFERQVFDFTHLAGRFAKDRFEQSFTQGGFYGSGCPWPARTSRWGTSPHASHFAAYGAAGRKCHGQDAERQ